MAVAQSSTTRGLGPPAEMEDDARSALAASMEGNSGGGQKRKRKEQEEDPNFLQIASSRRLVMLDSIVCVLKCFNSVLRFPVPADGGLGFRLETGSPEEEMIAGLIYSHVCSYILLYHLEKKKRTDEDSRSSDPSAVSSSSDEGIVVHAYEGGEVRTVGREVDAYEGGEVRTVGREVDAYEGGEVRTVGREVDDALWEVLFLEHAYVQPLIDGRRALVDDPTLRQRNGNGGAIEVSSAFDDLRDYNKGRRKQELLDVLHTLEVIGHARGYSPPEGGQEIMCYKEIRKQMSWYILHVQARGEFMVATGGKPRNTGEKPCDHPVPPDPFCYPSEPEALCFMPLLHQLEVSFEQMPEHLSLLKECKQRVNQLLSSAPAHTEDRVRDLVATMRAKDAALPALLRREPTKASFVKPRTDCLDHVIEILGRIRSIGEQNPTEEEVRMYSQIGEHVRSSIWLSHSLPHSQRKDKRSCEVYFDNAPTYHDQCSLSKSDAQGKHVGAREQLLEEIMAYLRALKSSCVGDVPSMEEEEKYRTVWRELYPGLLVCLRSRPMPRADEEPEEMPASELTLLERKVCYIYKRMLCFLGEVKGEICSVADVVHRALRPEQQLPPGAALGWFMTCEADAAAKAKEFVDRSQALGGMAKLEHALLVLVEMGAVGIYLFKLNSAVDFVEWAWHGGKKYTMVAGEVENAFGIIRDEKPLME